MSREIQNTAPRPWPYSIGIQNTSAEDVPAYGVVQITNSTAPDTTAIYSVGKPTGTASAKYVISAPEPIGAGLYGAATDHYPTLALISGVPSVNQEIGPVNGSWALSISGKGFIYLGGLSGGIGRVASKGGTSAGDDFPLVKIVNVSGVTRAAGSIVGYGPVLDTWGTNARVPVFQSAPPTAGKPFVILLTSVANGYTCDAAPVGTAETQVNFTDASHEYADAITNDYGKLASEASGPARILHRANEGIAGGGTLGLQAARVRILSPHQTDDIRGVSYTTISAAGGIKDGPITPGTGLAKLYALPTGAAGAVWQPQTSPVSVENWMFGSIPAYKPLILRFSRVAPDGSKIYTVTAEGCAAIPSG